MAIHRYITIFDISIQPKCVSIQYHCLMYHDMAIYRYIVASLVSINSALLTPQAFNCKPLYHITCVFWAFITPGNGYIDFDELRLVLKSCMDESALKFSEDKLDELTRALFEDADTDNSGTISFEELQAELDKHPGVVENLTIR